MADIGFVHTADSVTAQPLFYDFSFALGAHTIIPVWGDSQYGPPDTSLRDQVIDQLLPDKVKVIVAAGGLTCGQAVVQAVDKFEHDNKVRIDIPILFLGDKNIPHKNVWGGIILRMQAHHPHRKQALEDMGANRVGLLVNLNAAVGRDEDKDWEHQGWPDEPVGGAGTDNGSINLAGALDDLVNVQGVDGIVVASDPYFTSLREELVDSLNKRDRVTAVCYPFDIYRDGLPDRAKSICYGIRLSGPTGVYHDLAGLAIKVLAGDANKTVITVDSQRLSNWP